MRDPYHFTMNLGGLVLMILCCGYVLGQGTGITPMECVSVKYIEGVWMGWTGGRIAYLVKSPDIGRNLNSYQLYVREIADKTLAPGKLLTTADEISDVKWLHDDNGIAMLVQINGIKRLAIINAATGEVESTVDSASSIEAYSIDSVGDTVVYSVAEPLSEDGHAHGPTQEETTNGYRVSFGERPTDGWPISTIYIRRREPAGRWSPPQALIIENPVTHNKAIHLAFVKALSLSPNGRKLLFTYLSDAVPREWAKDPLVIRHPYTAESLFEIMVLYDVDTAKTNIAFQSLSPASIPLWKNDSSSFLVNASSPIGSSWEADDIQDHRASFADGNLFAVNVNDGKVEEVLRHVPDHREAPLFWQDDGDVIVRSSSATVARLHRFQDSWREADHVKVAQRQEDRFLYLVSNGKIIMGTHESLSTPRDLFVYEPGRRPFHLLTDLNPQIRDLRFAPIRQVHWTTSEGLNITGLLFVPPDYSPGTRYPLVINTKGNDGLFTCDSGYIDDPSFAPQPMATSGIMYLIRTRDEGWKFQEEIDKRPKAYPGGIGEAVQQMDIWDSAIDALDKRGLIDRSRVGIIGFSRTGWQVEFDLVHARTKYAAATATDNVQYSLSEYWLCPWLSGEEEQMYGGPPQGRALENWQKYSISFNLDKVHTPLLMEVMGYGIREDDQNVIPTLLAIRYEISRGLARLGKPVEMYFYPDEVHQPEHPKARIASEQRNVDWYRFWLQGIQDTSAAKKVQYERWQALKRLHEEDLSLGTVR